MNFDSMHTWRAMTAIEAAAALGFNGLCLTPMQKWELEKMLKDWARKQEKALADYRASKTATELEHAA